MSKSLLLRAVLQYAALAPPGATISPMLRLRPSVSSLCVPWRRSNQ